MDARLPVIGARIARNMYRMGSMVKDSKKSIVESMFQVKGRTYCTQRASKGMVRDEGLVEEGEERWRTGDRHSHHK